MTAHTFTTVHNPAQGDDATVHLAVWKDGYHKPACGTRVNAKKLVISSGQWANWITCERCRKKLINEGILYEGVQR